MTLSHWLAGPPANRLPPIRQIENKMAVLAWLLVLMMAFSTAMKSWHASCSSFYRFTRMPPSSVHGTLSSAGLVYTYYGEEVIQTLAPKEVYESFIEEIDAIDNGVPMTSEEPKYKIRTHLSSRYTVNYFISVWLPARDYVKSSLENRLQIHGSGEIIEFTERFPWKEHLFDLESEMGISHQVKYVLFNDKPNSWRGCVFCHSTGFIGGNVSREGALKMAIASLEAD
ncbi:Uncharacterized protein OBRU01_10983 [Operophtera brumata]|uniref:Uncharacterized protein n=1 Tax=Operophtera brumata TaxID=104452 RepID=A0A0L7LCQ6_OPEBR|nr:Uncharacterized protein OBRU01_10983 [Operophtera brumata]